jgi:uncharacterized protein (PEP-CTERM system associated)
MATPAEFPVRTQSFPPEPPCARHGVPLATLAPFLLLAGHALAQSEDGAKRTAWSIVPRVSATQTFTDNVALSQTNRQSDFITELSPGVRMQADTARLKAYVDYALREYLSAKESGRNRTQNSLTSFATLEAVEKWLYIEANASIAQQAISAFGTQAASTANVNANSTETATYRVSPYIKGRLASTVDYNLRLTHSETRSQSALTSNLVSDDISGRLSGIVAGPVGWALDATKQSSSFAAGMRTELQRIGGRLSYKFNPEVTAFVSGGTESNNYSTATRQSYTNFGYGGDWTPNERTRLSVSRERRSFGDSHSINFSYRTPLTAWRFTDSRTATSTPNQTSATGLGTYYDLFNSQLLSSVPDPVARAQQVNALLQQSGIAPNASITGGFLPSRVSIQRRQELSLVLNGLRNTVTYTLFQTDSQSFNGGAVPVGTDDFSQSSLIKTRGMSSNYSHRLTPVFSLNALSSWTRTSGGSGALAMTQKLFNFNVSGRLSPKVNASIGLRRVVSEGDAAAYTENAILGTVTAQF